MGKGNNPIKHHYILAFYLKRWAVGSDGRLCQYSKPYMEVVANRRYPAATGFEARLYELKGYEPHLAQQVEELFFKPVDGWAADSLDLLERHGHNAAWTNHSRSAWSRFILSLLIRCPEDIATFREWWHEDFSRTDEIAELEYRARSTASDPSTFAEYLAARPISEKERYQFEVFYSLVDHEVIGGKINEMHWRVL